MFEADNKSYTAGASNYLKAALRDVSTAEHYGCFMILLAI